jgi:hypothetical protein
MTHLNDSECTCFPDLPATWCAHLQDLSLDTSSMAMWPQAAARPCPMQTCTPFFSSPSSCLFQPIWALTHTWQIISSHMEWSAERVPCVSNIVHIAWFDTTPTYAHRFAAPILSSASASGFIAPGTAQSHGHDHGHASASASGSDAAAGGFKDMPCCSASIRLPSANALAARPVP